MLPIQYRPMVDTSWLRPADTRRPSQFSADWHSTMALLEREVLALDGEDLTIELEVLPAAIRADGTGLKARQLPASPAVGLSFESKHGPLTYRADALEQPSWRRGEAWRQNVRAIALTLESLRAVDRYGATETGQQYAGFKALPAGRAMPVSHMTRSEAAEVLERMAIGEGRQEIRQNTVLRILADASYAWNVWKHARAAAHPDQRGGDRTGWDQVEQAGRVLGVSS